MARRGVSLADPVSDLFTRIRNGQMARRVSISAPYFRFGMAIIELLARQGYVLGARIVPPASPRAPQFDTMEVFLKYDVAGSPAIKSIKRWSKPSRRFYTTVRNMPGRKSGLATVILTTPKGVLTCFEAKAQRVGGELLGIVE